VLLDRSSGASTNTRSDQFVHLIDFGIAASDEARC
jgi:hypothetical protein